MKNRIAAKNPAATEALLEGLIAECHAIIRNDLVPMLRQAEEVDRRGHVFSISELMANAVQLGDAIGRLRGTAPNPEIRQRITVERVQRLAAPQEDA